MKNNINLLKNIIINKFDNKNLINRYSKKDMRSCIINQANLKHLDSFVLQGICVIENNIVLSCYDSNKKSNSKLIILSEDCGFINECILDTKSHVGGICYDDINKIIWVTDNNGTISGYNKDDVFNNSIADSKYSKVKLVDNFKNIYGQNAIAYITYYKKQIYIGNYNYKNESFIHVYDVLKSGNIKTKPSKIMKSDYFIQGITFINKHKREYLITSSSIGYTSSKMKIYKYDDLTDLNLSCYDECVMPRMLEQIYYYQDKLYLVYEANANKFINFGNNNDVSVMNIDKLLKNCQK